jgi:hypothetical protein
MNCFYHPDREIVATCVDCGKGLCKECASHYEAPICDDCNLKRVQGEKNLLFKKYIPSILLFIMGFIVGYFFVVSDTEPSEKIGFSILIGYALSGTIWGWYSTRNMFAKRIYVHSGSGLDASHFFESSYAVLRCFVAAIVGSVALPVGIVRLILGLIRTKNKEKTIKNKKTDM